VPACGRQGWGVKGIIAFELVHLFMEIEVKLFAIFQQYFPPGTGPYSCKLRLEREARAEDVLNYLKLPKEMPKILLLNGIQCKPESKLREGDVLSIFPPIGGG